MVTVNTYWEADETLEREKRRRKACSELVNFLNLRHCLTECVNKELLYKASRGVYVLPDVWEDECLYCNINILKESFCTNCIVFA
jgi:hypothetical protein